MKSILFGILFTLLFIRGHASAESGSQEWKALGEFSIEKYSQQSIPSDFGTRFDRPGETSFLMLREYLWEKQEIEYLLKEAVHEISQAPFVDEYHVNESIALLERLAQGQGAPKGAPLALLVDMQVPSFRHSGLVTSDSIRQDVIASIRERLQRNMAMDSIRKKTGKMLLANLHTIQQDITSCEYELSRQLSTEYREQRFRTQISIAFTVLIALLLAAFFLIIYLRSDIHLPSLLLGGTGLQFVSLFVLIIAIILFGILNVLEGRELAAILSGISGYILGKGLTPEVKQPAQAAKLPNEQNEPLDTVH